MTTTREPRDIIAAALGRATGAGPAYWDAEALAVENGLRAAGWSLLPPGGREALDKLRAAVDDALIYDDGAVRAAAADLASHLTEGTETGG